MPEFKNDFRLEPLKSCASAKLIKFKASLIDTSFDLSLFLRLSNICKNLFENCLVLFVTSFCFDYLLVCFDFKLLLLIFPRFAYASLLNLQATVL